MNASYRCPRCGSDSGLRASGAPDASADAAHPTVSADATDPLGSDPFDSESSALLCCDDCRARYPIICGIPDLRIAPDPYIGLEADRRKARGLAERFDELDLAGLVDHYFAITPEVPPALAARYRVGLLESGPERIEALLAFADRGGEHSPTTRVLELACGSGPFLPALASRFERVVAVDIALRWLVVARKRLQELGLDGQVDLVCGCAEALPFESGRFDLSVAANALEHVRDAPLALSEVRRTLASSGTVAFTTPNRFSPGPDPHVGVWGIGFLPRSWQDPVARKLSDAGLSQIHTRGYGELRRMLAEAGLPRADFELPAISQADIAHRGALARWLGRLYNAIRRAPVLRPLLLRLGPLFQIIARP